MIGKRTRFAPAAMCGVSRCHASGIKNPARKRDTRRTFGRSLKDNCLLNDDPARLKRLRPRGLARADSQAQDSAPRALLLLHCTAREKRISLVLRGVPAGNGPHRSRYFRVGKLFHPAGFRGLRSLRIHQSNDSITRNRIIGNDFDCRPFMQIKIHRRMIAGIRKNAKKKEFILKYGNVVHYVPSPQRKRSAICLYVCTCAIRISER